MTQMKHVVKCRKCGHIYDIRICDLNSVSEIMEDIITTTGVWVLTRRKCPQCDSLITMDISSAIEIDVEQL